MGEGLLLLLILFLFAGCAKDMPPPGGPPDTTPPDILATTPAAGSTNVGVNEEIIFEFTERVNSKTIGNALFISPPLRSEPRVRVKGSRVRITPSDPIDSGKTYVVTLGASVADLNGNKLKNSLTLAFSTGSQIDSGGIAGRIFENNKPLPNFRIFAYSQRPLITDSLFDIVPDYITESGIDGEFKFDFVTDGEYLVLGVEDKDRDNKISHESERVAIPVATEQALPAELRRQALALHVTRYDSAMISLVSCAGYAGRVVIHFSGGSLDSSSAMRDSIYISKDSLDVFHPDAAAIFSREPERLYLWSTRFLDDSIFNIAAPTLRGADNRLFDFDTAGCLIRIRGTDTEPPDLDGRLSVGKLHVIYSLDSLLIRFNEPINLPSSALSVIVDSLLTLQANAARVDPLTFAIFVQDSTFYDRKMKLRLDLTQVSDFYGNAPRDSMYIFDFMLANPDSMGTVSGNLDFSGHEAVTLKFTGIGRKLVYTQTQSTPGPYKMTMYPDLYTVISYADRNQNGQWDHGTLEPFRYAEPGWLGPDTIRVRARFDTEGYDLELK